MTDFDDLLGDDVGVPAGEGESWGETAERLQQAEIDLSCPEGCYDLTVSGSHASRDAFEFLEDEAIADDYDDCPHCGAAIEPEVVADD